MAASRSRYAGAEWQDVEPIPQNEGTDSPIAAIAYKPEYNTAMSILRAVMAKDEASERVLKLTEHIILMNPAHYTVWLYRAEVLKRLEVAPEEELDWMQPIALKHLKNYQIWSHRQIIMSQLKKLPATETAFLAEMFSKDAKNYHVWSYRQWMVQHFNLWESSEDRDAEFGFVETLLEDDIFNNSAWNHRYFLVTQNPDFQSGSLKDHIVTGEIEFAKRQIQLRPSNQSSWNYLKGMLKHASSEDDTLLIPFAQRFVDLAHPQAEQSPQALAFLLDIWQRQRNEEKANVVLAMLRDHVDPIRRNYWTWLGTKAETV